MKMSAQSGGPQRIVVLNPKGGCGKTTLATNLASRYAQRGAHPTLIDCDPQGFSMRWLDKRARSRPAIYGLAAYGDENDELDRPEPQLPTDGQPAIIDLPAAIASEDLHTYTHLADSVLIPIVPSEIDVHAASRFIAELLLDAQLDRRERKLAIVANRVRAHTRSYRMLQRFLSSLRIPMIATLRDTQYFVHAASEGIGIGEMPPHLVKNDVADLDAVLAWLDKWQARRLELARPRRFDAAFERDWELGPELGYGGWLKQ
jgi:chromosome partitioning protein